jgi:hypothetical protein
LVVMMHYSREHFALTLRRTGFPEVAEKALRVLPDPVEEDQIAAFLAPLDRAQAGHRLQPQRLVGQGRPRRRQQRQAARAPRHALSVAV